MVYHYTKLKPNLSSSQFIKANKLLLPQSNISAELAARLLLNREVRRQNIQSAVSPFLHTDAGTVPQIKWRPLPSTFPPFCGFLHEDISS
jgi:hypothetical protein